MHVAGTDFASTKAVDHIKNRLRRLAFEVCVPNGDGRELLNADQRTCIATATADGLAQIDSRREQALRNMPVDVASAQTDTHPGH